MNIFVASLLAFLPERSRRAWLHGSGVPAIAGILSGAAELLVFFDLLIHHYFAFANHWLRAVPDPVWMGGFSSEGEPAMMGLGVFVLIGFVLQPLTTVLLYFSLEGAVRMVAAVLSGEVAGSLPFWLIAFAQGKAEAWREEAKMGPRIADQVEKLESEAGDLRVASCRPKPDWDDRVTISYQQMLYEVAKQENGVRPRPFVYLLKRKPEYKVIRALRHYHPEEVLRERK